MWLAVDRDGEYELAVVYDREDGDDRSARRRGRLGGPSQCAVRAVDRRHLERLHHAIPRELARRACGSRPWLPAVSGGHVADRFAVRWTLRLKDISSGYHHYYRVAGANAGCAALGVDCLKRVGAQMVDEFVPDLGPEDSVNLHRVR